MAASPTLPANHGGQHPVLSLKGDNASIRDSAVLTANWVASTIVDCTKARKLALTIKYDADADGTANKPQLIIMASNAASEPAVIDDEWGVLAELEGTGTDAVITDTLPTNVDFTITPEFVVKKSRGLVIDFYPSDNGTDKIRHMLVLNVDAIKYLVVLAKEEGDTTADQLGVLALDAALSA